MFFAFSSTGEQEAKKQQMPKVAIRSSRFMVSLSVTKDVSVVFGGPFRHSFRECPINLQSVGASLAATVVVASISPYAVAASDAPTSKKHGD